MFWERREFEDKYLVCYNFKFCVGVFEFLGWRYFNLVYR